MTHQQLVVLPFSLRPGSTSSCQPGPAAGPAGREPPWDQQRSSGSPRGSTGRFPVGSAAAPSPPLAAFGISEPQRLLAVSSPQAEGEQGPRRGGQGPPGNRGFSRGAGTAHSRPAGGWIRPGAAGTAGGVRSGWALRGCPSPRGIPESSRRHPGAIPEPSRSRPGAAPAARPGCECPRAVPGSGWGWSRGKGWRWG